MNNAFATAWWMNEERKRHERRAEDYDRRAKQARNDKEAERFRLDAERERRLAKRYDVGVRF